MQIEKNIFFIWLGDILPSSVDYVINSFKSLNPQMECRLIHKTIQDVNDIEKKCIKDEINDILLKSIHQLKQMFINRSDNFIFNQLKLYGKNVRFIQLLSDVFRKDVIKHFGGIYVDLDIFPVKSFDSLLNRQFCVMNYIGNSIVPNIDNYFFGCQKGNDVNDLIENKKIDLLVQTNIHWQSNTRYYARKKKFKECLLTKNDFPEDFSFYIEHYPSYNWKNDISKIPLCKYDFDEWFTKIKYIILK